MKGFIHKSLLFSMVSLIASAPLSATPNIADLAQELTGAELARLNASAASNAFSSGVKTVKAAASTGLKSVAQGTASVAGKVATVASGQVAADKPVEVTKVVGSIFTGTGRCFQATGDGLVSFGNLWKTKPVTALAGTVAVCFACYGLYSAAKNVVNSWDAIKASLKAIFASRVDNSGPKSVATQTGNVGASEGESASTGLGQSSDS